MLRGKGPATVNDFRNHVMGFIQREDENVVRSSFLALAVRVSSSIGRMRQPSLPSCSSEETIEAYTLDYSESVNGRRSTPAR